MSLVRVTFEIVSITPATAESWLTLNKSNRRMRQPHVDALARDMLLGRWVMNAEPIRFDQDSYLIDGQHRLAAVVKSGITITSMVAHGLPPEAQSSIDIGARRLFRDQLTLSNEENVTLLASVARYVACWEFGDKMRRNFKPTHAELADVLDKHPELREACHASNRTKRHAKQWSGVVLAMFYYLAAGLDEEFAQVFMARLADGANLSADHPILVVRNRIMFASRKKPVPDEQLALLIFAWNALRAGRTSFRPQMPQGGLTNDNYPEPR